MAGVSATLGRPGAGLGRRLDRAIGSVHRATEGCETGHLTRARAALRAALRRLVTTQAKIRSRAGRKLIPGDLAADLERLVGVAVADVKSLRDGLSCP